MLYLAEVQKQKGGLLSGGAKTELKLLACQRSDQNWITVSEETIVAEEASKLNDGALVLVELSANRHVQRIQDAGRPLVNILQNFSRQLEKFKLKEEEIDEWKKALLIQVQELNRREMDMEARYEQVQQLEESLQNLETEKQEVQQIRQKAEKLRIEVDRNRQELEGAWEHLRGEQRRLEQIAAENCQQGQALDMERGRLLVDLLNRLSSNVVTTETVRENLNFAFELVERQQAALNPHWQQMELQRTLAHQQQEEYQRLETMLGDRQNQCQQIQNSLEQQVANLHKNITLLASKQDFVRILKDQLRLQEDLYLHIQSLAANSGDAVFGHQVDVESLQNMPREDLQQMVQDLQEKLNQDSTFVQDQEQELKYKQETIEELRKKIQFPYGQNLDHLRAELIEEEGLYQMLNETLVGQRRSLLQRQNILRQHQVILLQRLGYTDANQQINNNIDFRPVMLEIEALRQKKSQELQNLERDIEQLGIDIDQTQGMITNQTHNLEESRQEVGRIEENITALKTSSIECWAKVNLYQEALRPIQDALDGLRLKLQAIAESLTQVQASGDHQQQAITEMRQTIQDLLSVPELLAS
ncbi:pilus motility taxis protein HmpF [Cronbergia sp. UHCC 0137]|uniref:pilus motility taxis protein HmpF n=1 Tax=Cronbergia sp. UHCC 0137 TaxID=3110239 RepID=UPI002B20B69F|nr:pilus motility taxis protein HmpF [Cronbergia sp. UHCC 0137]MEA5617918.1 pilus motility taxis protein HmpF [Cronbergia sp. UHCC 0137]